MMTRVYFTMIVTLLLEKGLSDLHDNEKKILSGLRELLSENSKKESFVTCNMVLFTEMVDYDTAGERCKRLGLDGSGKLAVIDSIQLTSELSLLLRMAYPEVSGQWAEEEWVWAGLRKTGNLGEAKESYSPVNWEWTDGSHPTNYSNWVDTTPSPDKGEGPRHQMRINYNGGWETAEKSEKYPFVCDYRAGYLISDKAGTWTDAHQSCKNAGLEMAKVRSNQEIDQLHSDSVLFLGGMSSSESIWASSNWMWLGGRYNKKESVWEWSDGEPFGDWYYEAPWAENQPDHARKVPHAGVQNCLAISQWGEFDDSYDSPERKRAFACQCKMSSKMRV